MGRGLRWFGRLCFLALLAFQCIVLGLYPSNYGNERFSAFATIYVLPFSAWYCIMCCSGEGNGKTKYLWFVWLLYSVAVAVMVGVIFYTIVIPQKLQTDGFYGHNALKMTLCIAPAEMLLLLNTAADQPAYNEALAELSFTAPLDLYDGIEMLEVILENSKEPHAIPDGLKKAIVCLVCVLFVLSFSKIAQTNFTEGEIGVRRWMVVIENVIQGLLNLSFLVIRIYLWSKNGRDAAIFITKNIISLGLIVVRLLLLLGVPY